MRRLAILALLLTACSTTTRTVVDAPQQAGRFKILQINDVYKIEGLESGASGGLARIRTLRTHLESDGTPVLVLHGGDVIFPSVMSKYLEGRPMIDVMNLLDGDADAFDPRLVVTFGNHEFDHSNPQLILDRLRESSFQWVLANGQWCKAKGDCAQSMPEVSSAVKETVMVDADGVKVGMFGVLYPLERPYVKTTAVEAAAQKAVASLRADGARVVIAVTHQDMSDDAALLRNVPGVDLVIGGHDHIFMQQKVGDGWVTKADSDALSVVVYDVTVPPSGRVRTAPLRVVLDETTPKDPFVQARVEGWLAQLTQKLGGNEIIGSTRFLLEGTEPAIRGRETGLGNLLADVARQQMATDIALVNGGGVRINDNIPPGPITRYDMEGIFYYTNRLVAFRATGAQLLELLRNSVSRADAGDGRFLQVSGLSFRYRPVGDGFLVEPADVLVGGKPLALDATYTIAVPDYLYQHGIEDGYELFTDARRPPKVNADRERDFREAVEAYVRKAGLVEVGVSGRIVRGGAGGGA